MARIEHKPTLAMKRTAARKRDRAQYGAKREKILSAAGIVLQRNGLAGTSIEAIAKEAQSVASVVAGYWPNAEATGCSP